MKNIFQVTSNPTKSLVIKASYEKDGMTFYITKAGVLKSMLTDDYVQKIFENNGRGIGCKKFVFKSIYHKDTQTYTNTTETYTEGKKDSIGVHSDYIEFWKNYPGASIDGKPNSESTDVFMTNLSQEVDTKSTNFRKRLKVSNIIEAMADGKNAKDELGAIMEYLGRNPLNMSVDQIVLALIDTAVDKTTGKPLGILMDETVLEDFNRTFVDDSNNNKEYIIAVNKAINHKIIVQRQMGDAKAYYWNDNHMGVSIPDVRAYFMKFPPMFKSLCAVLDKISNKSVGEDKIIPENAKSKVATEKSKMIEALTQADKTEFSELEGKNFAFMSAKDIKTLYDKITAPKS